MAHSHHSDEQWEKWMSRRHSGDMSSKDVSEASGLGEGSVKMRYRAWRLKNGHGLQRPGRNFKKNSTRITYDVNVKPKNFTEVPLIQASTDSDQCIIILAKRSQLSLILGELNANR